MTDIQMGGGWGDDVLKHCSPAMAYRLALADADDARQDAAAERDRQILAEMWEQDNVRASLINAENRGQVPSGRQELMNGIGRTRAEALAWQVAVADREDAIAARAAMKAGLTSEDLSCDSSAPHVPEPTPELLNARASADASKERQDALYQANRHARTIARAEAAKVGNVVLDAALRAGQGGRW